MDSIKRVAVHGREMRRGKTIDLEAFLEEMYEELECDLKASVETFETYHEVSEETQLDVSRVTYQLDMLKRLDYIDSDEFENMVNYAKEKRFDYLKALEAKDEKDRS